jgi:hypothetical protein
MAIQMHVHQWQAGIFLPFVLQTASKSLSIALRPCKVQKSVRADKLLRKQLASS